MLFERLAAAPRVYASLVGRPHDEVLAAQNQWLRQLQLRGIA